MELMAVAVRAVSVMPRRDFSNSICGVHDS